MLGIVRKNATLQCLVFFGFFLSYLYSFCGYCEILCCIGSVKIAGMYTQYE